jgi:hypothetical protein
MKLLSADASAKSVRVHNFAELPLPAGGMINGIITNEDIMARFFAHAAEEYGFGKEPAQLVINSNVQAKSLEVPPVSESMILDFIRREYSQFDENTPNDKLDENVYDYTTLSDTGPSGGMRILAVGVARDFLEVYRRTLTVAGFDLKRIDIGLNCQIKLARVLPQLQQDSVIFAFVDGRALSLTLFNNGNYSVSNRYRMTRDENDPTLSEEIGGSISSMIQFNQTQKDRAPVTAVYIAGVSDYHLGTLISSLAYLSIGIRRLDMSERINVQTGSAEDAAKFDADRYLLNIGNLLKM